MIREATLSDCYAIAEIYNQYLGQSTMDTIAKTASYYEAFIRNKEEGEELWILEIDHLVIAWGVIKLYSPKLGYRYTAETSVYLDKNHLNQGRGTRLKLHLINRCRDIGYHHLLARIFASNQTSISYNQKLGYEIVGIQKEVGYVNGHWQDVVIMQLIL